MATEIAIESTKFLINGRPTYAGVTHNGKPVEGLLLNSRMIQAVFDDACPETRAVWAYPDTGRWDPDRNTDEFCAHLPEYRAHGLLAVTVGLQGGGAVFRPEVYDRFLCSAYRPDGSFEQPYFDRLARVLDAADDAGVVVIVNYFYWKQVQRIPDDDALRAITERVTGWLLQTGHRNILVDVANESAPWWRRPALEPGNIHEFIELAQAVTRDGRRLLVGSSSGGMADVPHGRWLACEDFSMPHGNSCTAAELAAKLRRLKQSVEYRQRPRPIVVNEDSVFLENLEAAVAEGCSWGFYCQGYGSDYRDLTDWTTHPREARFEDLSGYQTLPVNWGINTPVKRAFFEGVRQITGGA